MHHSAKLIYFLFGLVIGGLAIGLLFLLLIQTDTSELADTVPGYQEAVEVAEPNLSTVSVVLCPDDYTAYHMRNLPLDFCYPNFFGAPVETQTVYDGTDHSSTNYYLSFTETEDVTLVFEAADFQKSDLSELTPAPPEAGFDCLLMSSSNEELTACFGNHDQLLAIESYRLANGLEVFHAKMKLVQHERVDKLIDQDYLLVPKVTYQQAFNLRANSTEAMLPELKRIVETMSVY